MAYLVTQVISRPFFQSFLVAGLLKITWETNFFLTRLNFARISRPISSLNLANVKVKYHIIRTLSVMNGKFDT